MIDILFIKIASFIVITCDHNFFMGSTSNLRKHEHPGANNKGKHLGVECMRVILLSRIFCIFICRNSVLFPFPNKLLFFFRIHLEYISFSYFLKYFFLSVLFAETDKKRTNL
jgi:hypothetical protein